MATANTNPANEEPNASLLHANESFSQRFTAVVQSSGAALMVVIALLFTFIIAVVALLAASNGSTVATAAFTAIGTIAGGYSGVRVGGDGKEQSDKQRDQTQLLVKELVTRTDESVVNAATEAVRAATSATQGRTTEPTKAPPSSAG